MQKLRETALGAVRAEIRQQGRSISEVSAQGAWEILDNLARVEPELQASKFYREASDNQIKLFFKEWNKRG